MKQTTNLFWTLLLQILLCHLSFAQKAKIWLDSSSMKKVYTPYGPIKGLIYIKNLSNELIFCSGQSEFVYTEDIYDANVHDPNAPHNNPNYVPIESSHEIYPEPKPTKEKYKKEPRSPWGPCKEGVFGDDYACLFPGMTYIVGGDYAQWFCFDKQTGGEFGLGGTDLRYPIPPGKYTVRQSAGTSSCNGGIFDWDFEIRAGESLCDTKMFYWISDAQPHYSSSDKNVDSLIIAQNKMILDFIDTCQNQAHIDMAASLITFQKVDATNCKTLYPSVFGKIIQNRALCLYLFKKFFLYTKLYSWPRDEKLHSTYRFTIHKELIKYLLTKDRILAETFFGDLYFKEVYSKANNSIPENIKIYLFTVAQMEELHQLFK